MRLYSAQFYILVWDYFNLKYIVMKAIKCHALSMSGLKSFIKYHRARYENNEIPYWYYIEENEL